MSNTTQDSTTKVKDVKSVEQSKSNHLITEANGFLKIGSEVFSKHSIFGAVKNIDTNPGVALLDCDGKTLCFVKTDSSSDAVTLLQNLKPSICKSDPVVYFSDRAVFKRSIIGSAGMAPFGVKVSNHTQKIMIAFGPEEFSDTDGLLKAIHSALMDSVKSIEINPANYQ